MSDTLKDADDATLLRTIARELRAAAMVAGYDQHEEPEKLERRKALATWLEGWLDTLGAPLAPAEAADVPAVAPWVLQFFQQREPKLLHELVTVLAVAREVGSLAVRRAQWTGDVTPIPLTLAALDWRPTREIPTRVIHTTGEPEPRAHGEPADSPHFPEYGQ